MKPAILIAAPGWDCEIWADRVRALLPGRSVLWVDGEEIAGSAKPDIAQVRYFLAWRPPGAIFERLPGLRVIFSLGAGVDHILALPTLPDVPLVRIVDADLTGRMTEYVVWRVLDHLRRGPDYARQQAERRWHELPQPAARQVSVGILGLGVMGADAAEVLLRLGFQVRGWSRLPKAMGGVATFHGPDGLGPFLAGTDILVSLLPFTPQTAGLIDAAMLRKLRRDGPLGGPVLVNAGRGGTHVEAEVAAALQDGTLAGASLDVFEAEPLSSESRLWGLDNLVITPHAAASSDPNALVGQIAAQIEAFERGEPLKNLVDRSRGY